MCASSLLVLALAGGVGQHVAAQPSRLAQAVNMAGNAFMNRPTAVGLSVGVYDNGQSEFYNFGTTELGKVSPPSKDTLYEIGSITKTFTSYLLAKAVLERKVSLQDDIRRYLDGAYPFLERDGQPVRVVHLANTTSGLPDWLPAEPQALKDAPPETVSLLRLNLYQRYTREDFFSALQRVRLAEVPGTNAKHSNAGAQLLAYLLENVYKRPFERLIAEDILQPNEMSAVTFSSSSKAMAKGYDASGRVAPYTDIPYFRSMGGLKASAADLMRYVRMQLDDRNHVSQFAFKRTIEIDATTNTIRPSGAENRADPGVFSIGLNWLIYRPEAGSLQVWADGGTSGFSSYVVLYPEINCGVVLLANRADEGTFHALPGIASEIFKAAKP